MSQRILVITDKPPRDLTPHKLPHQELTFTLMPRLFVGFDGTNLLLETKEGENVFGFDAVYLLDWHADLALAGFITNALDSKGIPFLYREPLHEHTKLSDMALFAKPDINYPATVYANPHNVELVMAWAATKMEIKYPLIVKHITGSRGFHNYRVNSYEEVLEKVETRKDLGFLIQQCIPSGSDYRVVIVDGEPVLIVKRTRVNDERHTNYLANGAVPQIYQKGECDDNVWKMSVAAAKAVGRLDCTGVDIVVDDNTGKCYLMEANKSPFMADMHREHKFPPVFRYLDEQCKKKSGV